MIRHSIRLGIWAALLCATPATFGFPLPQKNPHPLEGVYEVSFARKDVRGGIRFLVSLKRDGSKWLGEVRETPVPVTVTNVTVTGRNSLTVSASGAAGGFPSTVTLKIDGRRITSSVNMGPRAATVTATKKAGEKATTIEGTYEGEGVIDGRDAVPFVLTVKRIRAVAMDK